MMDQGCQTFVARLVNSREEPLALTSIPVVSKYFDVFPKVLPSIPTTREVEFTIDIAPGTEQISKVPYRMTPNELKDLKPQLEEILEVGVI